MKKRQRKKNAKKKLERQRRVGRLGEALGPIFAEAIISTMEQPSWITGTPEQWLKWDNAQHWVRTSWGSRPPATLFRITKKDV